MRWGPAIPIEFSPAPSGWIERYVAGPLIVLAWRVGALSPKRAAHLLVDGRLSNVLIQHLTTAPTDRDRAKMALLMAALPGLIKGRALDMHASRGLVCLLDNVTSTLSPQRDVCLRQLGVQHPEIVTTLLGSVSDDSGFPLLAPLIMARLSLSEQDPDQLVAFQEEIFGSLRSCLRKDPQWERRFGEHLFIRSSVAFASSVGPAIQSLLARRGNPIDYSTLRLLVYCRRRLAQAQSLIEEKGILGRNWIQCRDQFMDWTHAYLQRARLAHRVPLQVGPDQPGYTPRQL